MQLRRLPRHSLRPLPPPVLPRMRHLRHRRLHLRQRRRRLPKLQPLRPETQRRPEEHLHRPGPRGPQPEHRNLHPQLQGHRRVGPHSGQVNVQDISRPSVEGVLPDGLPEVEYRRHCGPRRVAGVEWDVCIEHVVLWGIFEPGKWVGYDRQSDVAGLSGY